MMEICFYSGEVDLGFPGIQLVSKPVA